MKRVEVRYQGLKGGSQDGFRTGVSLHSHTMHSRESLAFIPRYCAGCPPVAWELQRISRKYREKYGRDLDYSRGYWTPPLPPRQALQLERNQIEQHLGLAALVSLTDHDTIQPATDLEVTGRGSPPVSMEWTVPSGPTYFHIGVHNLPGSEAGAIARELVSPGAGLTEDRRNGLLAWLAERPETLIVMNHPFWNQAGIPGDAHRDELERLLHSSGEFLHALELNGHRPRQENDAVVSLAARLRRPVVSGGDRHCCEPAVVINLTRAATFTEFAADVRAGASTVLFLHGYRAPMRLRVMRSLHDIMRDYPEIPGRVKWSDRVYCRRYCGETTTLSSLWNGDAPRLVRYFERAVRLGASSRLHDVLWMYQEFARVSSAGWGMP